MRNRIIALLTTGHFVTDLYQGALAAMLPLLLVEHQLSYAKVTIILFACNITSSLIQPIVGFLSDKKPCPWIIPFSILIVSGGISSLGIWGSYPCLVAAAVLGGVGLAGIHPEGARLVNAVSGEKKASAMSWFGIGGSLGIAVGPALITWLAYKFGLNYSFLLMIPAIILALVFAFKMKLLTSLDKSVAAKEEQAKQCHVKNRWGKFTILTFAISIRSILFFCMLAFVPIVWSSVLHQNPKSAGIALAIMNAAYLCGNITGGKLADEIGNEITILAGILGLIPLLPMMLFLSHPIASVCVFAGIGFCMALTYSPSVVLGQEYLPRHIGLSSGVTLGLAMSVGGIATPLLGKMADVWGIKTALMIPAALPALMLVLILMLRPQIGFLFGKRKQYSSQPG